MLLSINAFSARSLLGVLLAVVILLVMVTVHEFGHYFVGKLLHFKINEFSIGFGPALFQKKRKSSDELFSVRLLPLGGYCAFAGEDEEEESKDPSLFHNRKPWMRILVLLAGPFMNYLLALLLLFTLFFSFGQPAYQVKGVQPIDGVPSQYCLREDDIILSIGQKSVFGISDYVSVLNGKKEGDIVPFLLVREGERTEVSVMLLQDVNCKNLSDFQPVLHAIANFSQEKEAPGGLLSLFAKTPFFSRVGGGFAYSFRISGSLLSALGELLTGKLALSGMGGPVTTIALTSEYAQAGFSSFLSVSSYIGLNLAVFNLLPIPALDGSKIVLCLVEWIFKKPINRKVETAIGTIGFFAILGFAVLVDILHFI